MIFLEIFVRQNASLFPIFRVLYLMSFAEKNQEMIPIIVGTVKKKQIVQTSHLIHAG